MRDANFILPKFYRRFAYLFLLLALGLLAFGAYLVWARVTIIITPAQEKISNEFIIEVSQAANLPSFQPTDFVAGKIGIVEVEQTKAFPATGSKDLESDVVGEVTIINTYTKDQTLVATTRLASSENPEKVLIRLKKSVVVPAGSQLNVPVYPDKPAEFTKLAPMRFIFPGLWEPLWAKIYAQNEKTLGEKQQKITLVTAADLEAAKESLKEELRQQAISEFNQQLEVTQTLWPKLVSSDLGEVSYNTKEGDEVLEFSATMKLKAIIVAFDESQVTTLAREKLKANLASDKQLVTLDSKSLSYLVDSYNLEKKTAQVRVYIEGGSIIAEGSKLFNKDDLLGKTEEEVKSYFSQYSEIKSVEVVFSPPWLKKTPRIKDKISIEIKK